MNLNSIPEGWFNWINSNIGGRAVERLQYLDPDLNPDQVINWNTAARHAGYGCMLIYSLDDPAEITAHAKDLSGDVIIYPVSTVPTLAEMERVPTLLLLLREPEEFFRKKWQSIKYGKSDPIAQPMLKNVSPSQWFAYGIGLKRWIAITTEGQPAAKYRTRCPDFKIWNRLSAMGHDWPDDKLKHADTWDSKTDEYWHWSLSNPCTDSVIPEMNLDRFVAYYPMRQMPCCGVAVKESGELVPIGALPDEKNANGWVWADEKTNAAFQSISNEVASREPKIPVPESQVKAFWTASVLIARLRNSSATISKSSLALAFVAVLAITVFLPSRFMHEEEANIERGGGDSQVVTTKNVPESINKLKAELDALKITYTLTTKGSSTIIVVNSIDPGKPEVMAFLMRNKLAIPSHKKLVIEIRPQ
jgi:hypothetical protein